MSRTRAKGPRKIKGLLSAIACVRPPFIPISRPRGVRAVGLRYERALAKALAPNVGMKSGQWFYFTDSLGPGYCQPDIIIPLADCTLIIECKLSNYAEGVAQLRNLYIPIITAAYARRAIGIVTCRHLSRATNIKQVCASLDEALLRARSDEIPLLHWLGRGKP